MTDLFCRCTCGACVGRRDHENCSHVDPCSVLSVCGCACNACRGGRHAICVAAMYGWGPQCTLPNKPRAERSKIERNARYGRR